MAKVEDILRKAVETEDWLLACNLYTQMTGKALSPPSLSKLDEDFEDEIPSKEKPTKIPVKRVPAGETRVFEGKTYKGGQILPSTYTQQQKEPETNEAENFMAPTREIGQDSKSNDGEGLQMKSQPISTPKTGQYIGVSNEPFEDTLTDGLVDEQGNSLLQTETQRESRKAPIRGKRSTRITVECSICENTFSIAPSLAIGYVKDRPGTPMSEKQNTYKCNDCNSRKGRAKQVRENRDNQLVRKRRG